ncbi:WecB/TagA/CpsF family glycosyltransferase [Microbulbifer sp. YPW16]|uniref:WecB/TagA/CpsF family glycosyltransferase n=1 Tax=Microbulbifer sp. YPW16 TaxID=2904242 RepID=UPI001E34C7F5|nr:WecB/TagA/CpsF family glycosyltransferase [Microbulbifer sp. YPW16]UHQ54106.1 WecB/TagA/CpsF family glycosyltransferase [Microbulbifer sp. YPW16]
MIHHQRTIGACHIDRMTMASALEKIVSMSRQDTNQFVVTPNIDHMQRLVTGEKCDRLQAAYDSAGLSLCDSRILAHMLRLKGIVVPEVVPGSTLTKALFKGKLTSRDRVLLIGGDESVFSRIRSRFPHLNLAHYNPSMGFIHREEEVKTLVQFILRQKADYIFLALGSPQQELLAYLFAQEPESRGVTLCVGASLLFLSGQQQRAPRWLQKLSLEWVHRMLSNPRRLAPRYFRNLLALPAIYRSIRRDQRQPVVTTEN